MCTIFLSNRKNVSDLLLFLVESSHQTFISLNILLYLCIHFGGKGVPAKAKGSIVFSEAGVPGG